MGNSIYRYDTLYKNNVFVVNVGDVITVKLGANQNQNFLNYLRKYEDANKTQI